MTPEFSIFINTFENTVDIHEIIKNDDKLREMDSAGHDEMIVVYDSFNNSVITTCHKKGQTYHVPLSTLEKDPDDAHAFTMLLTVGNVGYQVFDVEREPFVFDLDDATLDKIYDTFEFYKELLKRKSHDS